MGMGTSSLIHHALFWIFFSLGFARCVNVHFENKDGGFFLKQSPRQHFNRANAAGGEDNSAGGSNQGTLLSVDRFTVFQSSQPISVRATYGPFSTKQTVPARYVVPDPIPLNATGASIDLQELATHHLDMSAHIVRNEVPRDSPVLRVLFHTGADLSNRRHVMMTRHHQVCIVLHASMALHSSLAAACSPEGADGVCLAQITIPSSWWPALPSPDKDGRMGKAVKTPPRLVQVAYSIQEPRPEDGGCQPQTQLQPLTMLALIPLTPAKVAYKEMQLATALKLLIPHPPLFPLSRMHIPVFLDVALSKAATAIVIRARVKSGIRLLNADPSLEATSTWNITVDCNPRHTGATVTLVRKELLNQASPTEAAIAAAAQNRTEINHLELFTWLVEITEEPEDEARIVWSSRLDPPLDADQPAGTHRPGGSKSTTKWDIQKDDVQAVVPISKNWEVLNTAVLTGRQVSQAMKVFIVSQAGKEADVTFQASCQSEDDSVLKVSSSCSSVYVDGSEARGSVNGTVLVKYGTYTGLAKFIVWMPEFPLDLHVPDTRLSQLKSWRIPDYQALTSSSISTSLKSRRRKRSYTAAYRSLDELGNAVERPNCRLRYQQTSVDVYARFNANDHDSGRTTFLINRRTYLRVTDLVLPSLRVSDVHIATVYGRVLQGRSVGRTEVQVLSPITNRVIGAKEVRVGNDKVGLTRLLVQVVSGLQLNISPDGAIENGYVAETSVTRKLTAQYQEGLLDIELEFSDGSRTPLRDISDTDYHLVVESLDSEVVAFAPMVASHHPRVIAVGEGNGDLLQVTLLLPEECRASVRSKSKAGPLSSAAASVVVDFSSAELSHRQDLLQNDGGSYSGSKSKDFSDLGDILRDDSRIEPNVQARQYQGTKGSSRHRHASMLMSPLEISMYVLLATFCFAIVVFVVSCVVYASKFRAESATQGLRANPLAAAAPGGNPHETTANAHDWVWLGRATLEPQSNRNSALISQAVAEMRITANPMSANYTDPDDCLPPAIDNVVSRPPIDSSTYSKSKSPASVAPRVVLEEEDVWNKPTPPPPLPPHGLAEAAAEYKPPVPPHRHLPDSAARKHHHHHHHHHRGSRSGRASALVQASIVEEAEIADKSAFQFDDDDDEPAVAGQPKQAKESDGGFVHCPDSLQLLNQSRSSGEIKRAAIVGNPMCSNNSEEEIRVDENSGDLAALDGLQLDMDYEQIMHYFENLKESNA